MFTNHPHHVRLDADHKVRELRQQAGATRLRRQLVESRRVRPVRRRTP